MSSHLDFCLYDRIGKDYDKTRHSDPSVVSRLLFHLSPKIGKSYLDVACGSGNYTKAIYENGYDICGLDISRNMLELARKKKPLMHWIQGDAHQLPFEDNVFDGAICVLATHQFQDLGKAFSEVYRVLKHGTFVIFSPLPEDMKRWWLNEYFPQIMRSACRYFASFDRLSQNLRDAGFQNIKSEKYVITDDPHDKFLYSGKYRPEIYLDPVMRSGISLFLAENQEEVLQGCERIKEDINSGKIHEVIKSHENDLGDYVFVSGDKLNR